MTKSFFERIMREGTVDTRIYRYYLVCRADRGYIERIELDKLDTTAALTDWEIVKEF